MHTSITPRSFAEPTKKGFIKAYQDELRRYIKAVLALDAQAREEAMRKLGKEFLNACTRGNPETVRIFVEEGMDVNHQDAATGATALHAAAGAKARRAVKELVKSAKCDYLLRDKKGRLASECAYLFGQDPALARLLGNKECKQAVERGIALARRP